MTSLTTVEEQRADLDRAAAGFEYDSSLMDDDVPHLLATDGGTRVEPPPRKLFELCTGELRAMHEEGCLGVLTMHPFLSGRPARALDPLYGTTTERSPA